MELLQSYTKPLKHILKFPTLNSAGQVLTDDNKLQLFTELPGISLGKCLTLSSFQVH